jgi:hypothetical protein
MSQCQDMMIPAEPASVPSNQAAPLPDQLRLAVAAYLARFKGSSREHTDDAVADFHHGDYAGQQRQNMPAGTAEVR